MELAAELALDLGDGWPSPWTLASFEIENATMAPRGLVQDGLREPFDGHVYIARALRRWDLSFDLTTRAPPKFPQSPVYSSVDDASRSFPV